MLNLIIFGSPGAGKGTQAELIAKKYKLIHLSSGDILRQELKKGDLGKKIKSYQDAGKLVPDSIIIEMMEKTVAQKLRGHGFVFDGYPRNLGQAKHLDKFLRTRATELSLVLNLQLSETEAARRILLRGKTSGRSDDNRKTVKSRYRVYRAQTAPLLDYYRSQGKTKNIDGRPSVETISGEIKKIIDKLK